MKISIIGPGIMPIPPKGWGAVESLIWDYNIELKKLGHDVQIVNTQNRQDIINQVILTSDYGRQALEEANQTPDGKVVWWRIETHLHNISNEDPKTGTKEFRLGGFLTKITDDYVVISNGNFSWSVQKKTSVFFQKLKSLKLLASNVAV